MNTTLSNISKSMSGRTKLTTKSQMNVPGPGT